MNAPDASRRAERGLGAIATCIGLLLATVACGKSANDPASSASEPLVVTFDDLSNWKYRDGFEGMPGTVKALDRKRIVLTGYVHSWGLDGDPMNPDSAFRPIVAKQKSYDRHSCDGPEPNEMVTVTPPKGAAIVDVGQRVKMIGTFVVECIREDGYVTQIYGLRADSIEVVR